MWALLVFRLNATEMQKHQDMCQNVPSSSGMILKNPKPQTPVNSRRGNETEVCSQEGTHNHGGGHPSTITGDRGQNGRMGLTLPDGNLMEIKGGRSWGTGSRASDLEGAWGRLGTGPAPHRRRPRTTTPSNLAAEGLAGQAGCCWLLFLPRWGVGSFPRSLTLSHASRCGRQNDTALRGPTPEPGHVWGDTRPRGARLLITPCSESAGRGPRGLQGP